MDMKFPKILKCLRKEKGLSQKEAAEQLNISQSLLSHYERGIRECSMEFFVKLADFYDVSTDYLFGRTERRTAPKNMKWHNSDNQNKREALDCVNILYDITRRTENKEINEMVHTLVCLYLYHILRILETFYPNKSSQIFSIPANRALIYNNFYITTTAGKLSAAIGADLLGKENDTLENSLMFDQTDLLGRYPLTADSFISLCQRVETLFKEL